MLFREKEADGVSASAPPREQALAWPEECSLPKRLVWGVTVSILFNFGLWSLAAHALQHKAVRAPEPIEITRLILPEVPRSALLRNRSKVAVPPKPPRHSTSSVSHHSMSLPPPNPVPALNPVLRLRASVSPHRTSPKPGPLRVSQSAHPTILIAHRLTAPPSAALPGGNVKVGVPASDRKDGVGTHDGLSAPPLPLTPPPASSAPVTSRQEVPVPLPATPPRPIAPPTVHAPDGPTVEAQAYHQVLPEIPDYLQQEDYKSSVHVTVEIDAHGTITNVTLSSSSGNADVDRRAVDAQKHWKWHPALRDGHAIASVQRIRFDFEVR